MSPFAEQLKAYRYGRSLRQVEFAELVGYEQSYVSSLELGIKGPPTDEFVEKLIKILKLSEEEQETLYQAVAASQRKIIVPHEASTEVYWLCHKFRQQVDRLHPVQIQLIETALNLPLDFNLPANNVVSKRIKRRDLKIHKTEAEM